VCVCVRHMLASMKKIYRDQDFCKSVTDLIQHCPVILFDLNFQRFT